MEPLDCRYYISWSIRVWNVSHPSALNPTQLCRQNIWNWFPDSHPPQRIPNPNQICSGWRFIVYTPVESTVVKGGSSNIKKQNISIQDSQVVLSLSLWFVFLYVWFWMASFLRKLNYTVKVRFSHHGREWWASQPLLSLKLESRLRIWSRLSVD